MKTIYYTASSLDGYIADADNALDWLLQFGDPGSDYQEFIAGVGAIAMGSTTYEWLLAHLLHPGASRPPQPWPYAQPAWVFTSRSLPGVPGADVRFVRGDVRPVHRQMAEAAAGRNVWLVGGGELVGQFHDHGLLDEIVVQIAPVTLGGRGAPCCPARSPRRRCGWCRPERSAMRSWNSDTKCRLERGHRSDGSDGQADTPQYPISAHDRSRAGWDGSWVFRSSCGGPHKGRPPAAGRVPVPDVRPAARLVRGRAPTAP